MPDSPNRPSFLTRPSIVPRIPNALLILMIVFFMVPFALRGARMAIEGMRNDVKDWLPADFQETVELEWFGRHFVGEQFVLLTWPGCTEVDQKKHLLVSKLEKETVPAELDAALASMTAGREDDDRADNGLAELSPLEREIERARRFGDRHALFTDNEFLNWGGQNEKWLASESGAWYYVTPDGEVYRWEGRQNMLGWISRSVSRMLGRKSLEGEHLATFGQSVSAPATPNPIYSDPRRLTARLFKTVETGPQLLHELADEGGPLWPFGDIAEEYKPIKARRDALERLTGTMFAPVVPEDFRWHLEDFKQLVPDETLAQMPAGWEDQYRDFVRNVVEKQYAGDHEKLVAASSSDAAEHWYDLFDKLGVPEPPRQTCIVVTLSEVGKRNLGRVLGRGLFGAPRGKLLELAKESGITPPPPPPMSPPPFNWLVASQPVPEPALRMGGPPIDNVAIDEEGRITQVRLIGYSVFLGLFLSYLCFRSLKITTMIFFVGGISAVASLSFIWWFGSTLDAVLMSMPPLVYVLGLSGAVHIVNYYRDAVEDRGLEGAAERALGHGWWPCTLAACTTAIGLMSLYTSNIIPIRKFGLFAAIGVIATLAVLFLYLPAAMSIFSPKFKPRRTGEGGETWLVRFWAAVGTWIVGHHKLVTVVCGAIFIGFGLGLTKINTSVQLLKLFDSEAKIIKDYEWLEATIGKLVPMELVIRVDPGMMRPPRELAAPAGTPEAHDQRFQLSFLERAEIASRVHHVVEREFGEEGRDVVGRAMSAATLMPELPPPGSASSFDRASLERMKFSKDLEQARGRLLTSDFLRVDRHPEHEGAELWRVSLRVGALKDVDYGIFVHDLKYAIEPVMSAYRYRNEILHGIDRSRGGEGFWRTGDHGIPRVLMLGLSDPGQTKDGAGRAATGAGSTSSAEEDQETGSATDAGSDHEVDQTSLFASTVRDLLINASFRTTAWHDPAVQPLADDFARSEPWAQFLGAFDAVVVVKDYEGYDLDYIREHAKLTVDARDHVFSRAAGTPTANHRHDGRGEVIHTVYTGIVPVVYKAQRTLLTSLIESIGWAFVLIAGVMTVLLNPGHTWRDRLQPRNITLGAGAGLSSMVPNVFPVAMIFGAMGHLGIRVDIGSMMTASVAMGVAVDDTIHFLTWYRDGIRRGLRRHDAIVLAYKRCGAAMTQTTVIAGLGLSVFAISTFTPTQQFGVLMLTLLCAALIGDLLFLPAILAGPLGKLFTPERDEPTRAANETVASDEVATDSRPGTSSTPHTPPVEKDSQPAVTVRRDKPH